MPMPHHHLFFFVLAICLALAGCSDDKDPNEPSRDCPPSDKDGVIQDVRKALLDDDDEEKRARRRAAVKRSLERLDSAGLNAVTLAISEGAKERSQRLKRFHEELLSIEDLDEREVRRQQLHAELSSRHAKFPREGATC